MRLARRSSVEKAPLQHIGERENQVHVYHQLRLLPTETEDSQFSLILQKFLTYMEKYHTWKSIIIYGKVSISVSIIVKG